MNVGDRVVIVQDHKGCGVLGKRGVVEALRDPLTRVRLDGRDLLDFVWVFPEEARVLDVIERVAELA